MTLDRSKAPRISEFPERPIPAERVVTTPGGVTVHFVDNGTIEANRVDVLAMFGNRQSTVLYGSDDYAAFAPQLVLEGTAAMDGATLAEALDYAGASVHTGNSETAIRWSVMSLNDSTPSLLDTLADVLTAPALPEDKFEKLRLKALQNFELARTRPATVAADALVPLVNGPEHPYLRKPDKQDIKDMSYQALVEMYAQAIGHSPLHVFFGGCLTPALEDAVMRFADRLRPSVPTDMIDVPVVPMSPEVPQRLHIDMPQSLQTAVTAAIPAIGRDHPDYIPLRLTVMALGGYFGSRLMSNLREEKGLTYGVNAALLGRHEGAYTLVNAQCLAETGQLVLDEIAAEMRRLATEPMDTAELGRLKSYAMSQLMSTLDTPMAIVDYYINRLVVGTPDGYFDAQQRAIRALDPDTVLRMSTLYLTPTALRAVTAGR